MPWDLADAVRRYEAGESVSQIAQALETPETTVYRRLLAGGLPPRTTEPWGTRRQGTRNYARERTEHAALAPEQQRALHDLLVTQLPAFDRAVIGQVAILDYLHQLGLRRRNGGPLTWRMILRWRRDEGFPVLRGRYTPHRHRSPALSTAFALTAWTLSRFSSDEHHLFRVSVPHGASPGGTRPAFHAA
jgi:hypothetical protein